MTGNQKMSLSVHIKTYLAFLQSNSSHLFCKREPEISSTSNGIYICEIFFIGINLLIGNTTIGPKPVCHMPVCQSRFAICQFAICASSPYDGNEPVRSNVRAPCPTGLGPDSPAGLC